jgi:hypothetical protein
MYDLHNILEFDFSLQLLARSIHFLILENEFQVTVAA